MANYTIDKFSYGGNNYTLQDNTKTLSAELSTDNAFITTLGDDATMLILEAGNNISINATTEGSSDVTYTISSTGGGASYTATSPIDITNSVISHETSGVTAGTYDGGGVKSTGFYIPSFTVDAKGHLTSATDLGTLIPDVTTANVTDGYIGGTISPYNYAMNLRNYGQYGTTISAGSTTSSFTINTDSFSGYTYRTYFRVADVQAYDVSTYEPVIVDWKTSNKIVSGGSSMTLTVSIASAYEHDIIYFPIVTYALISAH